MIPLDELENSGATRDGPSDADAKRFDFLASPCFNPYRGRTAHAHTRPEIRCPGHWKVKSWRRATIYAGAETKLLPRQASSVTTPISSYPTVMELFRQPPQVLSWPPVVVGSMSAVVLDPDRGPLPALANHRRGSARLYPTGQGVGIG